MILGEVCVFLKKGLLKHPILKLLKGGRMQGCKALWEAVCLILQGYNMYLIAQEVLQVIFQWIVQGTNLRFLHVITLCFAFLKDLHHLGQGLWIAVCWGSNCISI